MISVLKYHSPCGELLLGEHDGELVMCDWTAGGRAGQTLRKLEKEFGEERVEESTPLLTETCGQLDEYFSGQRKAFNLPYHFTGTEFQKRVWQSISRIVYGKTVSYEEISRLSGVGNAGMTDRAVANATGANKLSVIIPCHRIIRKSGEPGGYAGGKEAKRFLLELEEVGTLRC